MTDKRAIVIVLDSVGIGEAKDALLYGDTGADTLRHIYKSVPGFHLPHLEELGLGYLLNLHFDNPIGAFGIMEEKAKGKDSVSGHWEMMGLTLTKPFPTYPHGFPPEVIAAFERRFNTKALGNRPESGTTIIAELGEEHMRTGYPIVYTSADSVFQIAAHNDVIPLEKLYEMCEISRREILVGDHLVGRVIARPFTGTPGHFVRTEDRRDYAAQPLGPTTLTQVSGAGLDVIAVGKTWDLFNGDGFTQHFHTGNNQEGTQKTIELVKADTWHGLLFTNLVDFDMLYGHRRNVAGYAVALERFDEAIPELIGSMHKDDLLIISADHGCDPTFTGHTDHTREYVPLLAYSPSLRGGTYLGVREGFADLGATVSDHLGLTPIAGKSFLGDIR
ncbi:MAG TPA: phosphopentomutase [Candidatus Cryosericum sp.]|nr:phosphopentomutase [Candidatus Cryosericum sp.]HOV50444.1 phosphopentomutase [Candidatus Cryosericum sp.]HPS69851.1 phosphopentomutase [Candidatus Cryosericum sp.]